jgi:diguanylate cyclase (GGDEF)-like protein
MMNHLTREEATSLLNASPVAVLLLDRADHLYGFNDAFARLLGDAAVGLEATVDNLHDDGLLAGLLEGPLVSWIMPDGDTRWLNVETTTVNGLTAHFYQDVTEKLRLKQERDGCTADLQDQSLRHATLTSVLNRRGILVSLEPLVARSRRYNSPLSMVAMGLDSETERQRLLMQLSFLLKDQTRWADLVGCNGDHDFILVLQETTQDSALQLVEKLNAHLSGISEAQQGPVSARFGVTQCQKNDDAESLLERAEGALAEARLNHSGMTIAM